jgi:hypothetical protein
MVLVKGLRVALTDYKIGDWTPEWQQAKILKELIDEVIALKSASSTTIDGGAP